MINIILLHQTVADGDAIGNDISEMFRILKQQGYQVSVYCEHQHSNGEMCFITYNELLDKIKNPHNLIIYHHSIYWEKGEEIIKKSLCNVVVRYHNITPNYFFEEYSKRYYDTTTKGREQTRRLASYKRFRWLSDSLYNNNEILELGVDKTQTCVIPPFHKIELVSQIEPDYITLDLLLNSDDINILFVSRVAPNKGHLNICYVANSYKKIFGDNFKVWVVGGFDDELRKYNESIFSLIHQFNLENNITFTKKISPEELKSYFLGCDIFLCLSEHEGFGVPLIESQYFNLPVVAISSSAVDETLGENQLVFDNFNDELIASAINLISNNKQTRDYLISKGKDNYNNRFSPKLLEEKFIDFIKTIEETSQ
ncbi:glycosyltransferase [Paenibacillus sp. USDA918EY]|uniref:glycosyltransferase n=1 Tax=Paenibacillus sp. USDA918EY TaxID=2689575 RepID=UPI00135BE1B9|nr:glycosyltransferase [Paenibacillus sp. USDA918EY]